TIFRCLTPLLLGELMPVIFSFLHYRQIHPLVTIFSDFTGNNNYDEALEFIKGKFRSVDKRKKGSLPLLFYTTNATDTTDVQTALTSMFETIFSPSYYEATDPSIYI